MNTAVLTIDDVASRNTPKIVDMLLEKGIRAVLFATGENVNRFYDEAVYAVKSGMIVGNHSFSHPHFSDLTLNESIREIEACERVLDKLYQDAGIERKYRPFRFPYGDKGGENREGIQKYLRENGFHKLDDRHIPYIWWKESRSKDDIDTFWTYDFEEYRLYGDASFTEDMLLGKMHNPNPEYGAALFGEGNRHFILMHAHDETETVMPDYARRFIEYLLKNGITFDEPSFL